MFSFCKHPRQARRVAPSPAFLNALFRFILYLLCASVNILVNTSAAFLGAWQDAINRIASNWRQPIQRPHPFVI
jgi:hypothetical protein